MTKIISFQEALKETEGQHRTLLVGNGFSSEYFNYRNLLDKSGLDSDKPVRKLFSALGTVDFEAVVRALEGAAVVAKAYGLDAHEKKMKDDAQIVREALVEAVNATHPKNRVDLGVKYKASAVFLENFSTVFTLNYDLLLYWVNLEYEKLRDGFGLGSQNGSFRGPFKPNAYCEIYNLHGGLHLFATNSGEVEKAVDANNGVIATISKEIKNNHRLPIYVAEGTSEQKLQEIRSNSYLRHCYRELYQNSGNLFIYGHSADDNDAHIYRAIFGRKTGHIFFGVHKPDEKKLNELDGKLAKYQKSSGSSVSYSFFDSESAKVWAD